MVVFSSQVLRKCRKLFHCSCEMAANSFREQFRHSLSFLLSPNLPTSPLPSLLDFVSPLIYLFAFPLTFLVRLFPHLPSSPLPLPSFFASPLTLLLRLSPHLPFSLLLSPRSPCFSSLISLSSSPLPQLGSPCFSPHLPSPLSLYLPSSPLPFPPYFSSLLSFFSTPLQMKF